MEVSEEEGRGRWSDTKSVLPVGYRFSPTDEELIAYYLTRRVLNQPLLPNKVKEINFYDYTPEQLEDHYGPRREAEMYFFTKRKPNSSAATRANRMIAGGGFWRASSTKVGIKDSKGDVVGYKMLLNYYAKTKKTPDNMTNWIMYEYTTPTGSTKMDELVLCKIYIKRSEQKLKNNKAQLKEHRENVDPKAPSYQDQQHYWTRYGILSHADLQFAKYLEGILQDSHLQQHHQELQALAYRNSDADLRAQKIMIA